MGSSFEELVSTQPMLKYLPRLKHEFLSVLLWGITMPSCIFCKLQELFHNIHSTWYRLDSTKLNFKIRLSSSWKSLRAHVSCEHEVGMFWIVWMHGDCHMILTVLFSKQDRYWGHTRIESWQHGFWIINGYWQKKHHRACMCITCFLSWNFCQRNHPTGRHPDFNIPWLGCSGLPGLQSDKWKRANLPLQSWNAVEIEIQKK